ncbi:hypothetical protein ACI3SI_20135, partial [Lactococcus lactis]
LIFTAGVGENDTAVRTDVVNGLSWFGMEIDESKNVRGAFGIISKPRKSINYISPNSCIIFTNTSRENK